MPPFESTSPSVCICFAQTLVRVVMMNWVSGKTCLQQRADVLRCPWSTDTTTNEMRAEHALHQCENRHPHASWCPSVGYAAGGNMPLS